MDKTRAFYMVMASDEELAKLIRDLLERYKDKKKWWKMITKYYKGDNKDPFYETSESSNGK